MYMYKYMYASSKLSGIIQYTVHVYLYNTCTVCVALSELVQSNAHTSSLSLSPVSSHNLHRQGTSVNEPTRIQDNLGDHGIVWHHHGHRAEEGLKVVREFRSAGIPGVHSDEHTARGVQFDLRPLEQKSGRTRGDTCKCTVHVYIPQVYTLNYMYIHLYCTCTCT